MRIATAISMLLLAACGPTPARERGEELFSDPGFSASKSNPFSCATCHGTRQGSEPDGDPDRVLPGYALAGAARRPAWWGGSYGTLLDAVNECYVSFMRGAALDAKNEDGLALLVYLESISPPGTEQSAALPLSVVKDIADVPNGDAARGAATYAQSCASCHGQIHSGEGRLSSLIARLPDDTIRDFGSDPKTGARAVAIEKARHGRYFGIGGNMPLYPIEALSDAQLGDILAYLGL